MSDDLFIRAIPGGTGKYYYSYDVWWRGQIIVQRSHDPECAAARILVAKGLDGWVVVRDLETGNARLRLNLRALAGLTFEENDRAMRLAKWKPMPMVKKPRWLI